MPATLGTPVEPIEPVESAFNTATSTTSVSENVVSDTASASATATGLLPPASATATGKKRGRKPLLLKEKKARTREKDQRLQLKKELPKKRKGLFSRI